MMKLGYRRPIYVFLVGLLLPILLFSCRFFTPESVQTIPDQPPTVVVSTPVPPERITTIEITGEDEVLVDLYARVNPSVVNVTVFQRQSGDLVPVGQGSGFVYDNAGHIVTNAHVVHASEQVEVTFSEGVVRSAELVGEDLHSDLAVIRAENLPERANPLPLGDMDSLAVGQSVVAIGNPFGLEGTLTRGIISALGRSIPALTIFNIPQSIQTDAAINPGNSGGPLLNLSGEVIGVNAQIETGGTTRSNLGIGFAIPVSIVRLVVPDLIQDGVHHWAWLGISGGSLTPPLAEAMDLTVDKGAYIAEVISRGPASKAGLRGSNDTVRVNGRDVEVGGDVITAIDGQPVNTFEDLLIYIALESGPDQEVNLTILRNGETLEVPVTLEERPESLEQPS